MINFRLSLASIYLFFVILASGCQTNMLKQFDKITPGMEKDDVLEMMGSPTTSLRFHGKDRWIYVFYEDKLRFEKEIHFFENNVTYKGERWEPSPENQASKIDSKNEKEALEISKQNAQRDLDNKNAYDDYLRRVQKTDRVNYMPTFEPVQ